MERYYYLRVELTQDWFSKKDVGKRWRLCPGLLRTSSDDIIFQSI